MSKELIEKTEELLVQMKSDLIEKFPHQNDKTHYVLQEGRNYIKLVREQSYDRDVDDKHISVLGFIVKKAPKGIDNKTKQPFKVGDMLMAASWSSPATNFARGNILDGYDAEKVRYTGIY